MGEILVSGLVNVETTLPIDGFPLAYAPVRYLFGGVQTRVAGVGYNVARALTTLGSAVRLLSLVGEDVPGQLIRQAVAAAGIETAAMAATLPQSPQSVILYDRDGRRQIHTDLKDVQERPFPPDLFQQGLASCDLAVLGNVNWNRPFLQPTHRAGKLIATDVHTIADLDNAYNRDFMAAAHILFMSHERLPVAPEAWAKQLQARFGTPIIVIGLGAAGALLAVREDHFCERISTLLTRPVVNTIGAGDALFAAFIHFYHQQRDPVRALQHATAFASYKIGADGAAEGFLTEAELLALIQGEVRKS